MSPFRLFGRAPEPAATPADLDGDDGVSWAPGPWTAGSPAAGLATATRHARPVAFGSGPGLARVDDDPLTDPYGFPPIRSADRRPEPAPEAPLDPQEAAALAGAFAADYLSWDEDDPGRRGRALADHLAAPVGDPSLLGWDGRGRQRAEFALPGLVRSDGDDGLLVDVRVRVTPYRADGAALDGPAPDGAALDGAAPDGTAPEPDVPGVPAAAPAPAGRGWRGCPSYWIRLSVPVVREHDRLVVDATDESPADTDHRDTDHRDTDHRHTDHRHDDHRHDDHRDDEDGGDRWDAADVPPTPIRRTDQRQESAW